MTHGASAEGERMTAYDTCHRCGFEFRRLLPADPNVNGKHSVLERFQVGLMSANFSLSCPFELLPRFKNPRILGQCTFLFFV